MKMNRTNTAGRILVLLLTALMVLSLAACGTKGGDKMDGMSSEPKNAEEAVAMHKELMAQENAILSEDTALWEKVFMAADKGMTLQEDGKNYGEFLLDIIRANAPALGFELDSHWIHRGGQDPVKFIKKYAGSIRLVHLKDYRIGEMPIPEGGVDFTSKEGMMKFMSNFTNIVQFAEVGEGTLDMPAIIQAGLEGGGEYFLVEQDDCYGRDPFDSLKISHDNLVKMGFGDWF